MKALDLLKSLRDDYIHGELSSDINEAIAELEALQSKYDNGLLQYYKLWDMYSDLKKQLEPKSCDGCKFGKFGVDSVGLEVECELNWNCSIAHVNRYEPKDMK
jgi:hypothetical protein